MDKAEWAGKPLTWDEIYQVEYDRFHSVRPRTINNLIIRNEDATCDIINYHPVFKKQFEITRLQAVSTPTSSQYGFRTYEMTTTE